MYSWQHCGTGTLSYRQPRHLVITDQWIVQQRAFAIKMFYKNDSLESAQKEFRSFSFNLGRHGWFPSKHVIKTLIKNFEETGSALKKKPTGRPRRARTAQNIEAVRVSFSTAD
jgi:transposase